MARDPMEVSRLQPAGLSRWAFIRFGPDDSAGHPLRMPDGLANITAMRLPEELETRFRRWAMYWDEHFTLEHGWPSSLPAAR